MTALATGTELCVDCAKAAAVYLGEYCESCYVVRHPDSAVARVGGRNAGRNGDSDLSSLSSLISHRRWPVALHEDAFHGVAGDFVQTVAPESEADPAALLVTFLVGVGIAIGDGPHARVEGDRHPCRLFAVMVGDTGHGRKGTSVGRVKEPLTYTFPDYKDRIVNGLSSGEGIIQHVRDPEPREEDDDEPSESSAERRLWVVEGEFAQALKVASRSGNTLSAVIRNLWDTGDVRVLTRNSPLKATGAHVGFVGHITSEELAADLTASDTANGFANRFLWICTRRSKLLPDGGELNFKDLLPICNALDQVAGWAKEPRRLERDSDAREIWHQVYPELSTGHSGAFGKATSRAEAQVLRLSVLYAVLDRSAAISAKHLRAGLAVWRYAEDSARFIFGESSGDKNADRLLRVLKDQPAGLTRTEISHLFDRHLSADELERAIDVLSGSVEVIKASTGGRPVERVRLRREQSEVSEESQGMA